MARITLGMATAHGPQITLPPDTWDLRVEADRQNSDHWYRGKKYNFDQLVALRRSEKFSERITPEGKPVYGAMSQIGAAMTLVDYVPCYRSEAGTGNAMGFVYWDAANNPR